MGSYSAIDPQLSAWASEKGWTFLTDYKGEEVRSIIFEDEGQRRAQLWVDRPSGEVVGLHLWDFKARRVDVQSRREWLVADLNALAAQAVEW